MTQRTTTLIRLLVLYLAVSVGYIAGGLALMRESDVYDCIALSVTYIGISVVLGYKADRIINRI